MLSDAATRLLEYVEGGGFVYRQIDWFSYKPGDWFRAPAGVGVHCHAAAAELLEAGVATERSGVLVSVKAEHAARLDAAQKRRAGEAFKLLERVAGQSKLLRSSVEDEVDMIEKAAALLKSVEDEGKGEGT